MTAAMKNWLHDHGLTAIETMRRAGIFNRHYFYRVLDGTYPAPKNLHDTMCNVYGMSEEEWTEAIP